MSCLHIVCLAFPDWSLQTFAFILSKGMPQRWEKVRVTPGGGEKKRHVQSRSKGVSSFLPSGLNFLKTSRCFHLIMPFWRFPFCCLKTARLSWAHSLDQQAEQLLRQLQREVCLNILAGKSTPRRTVMSSLMNGKINIRLYLLRSAWSTGWLLTSNWRAASNWN